MTDPKINRLRSISDLHRFNDIPPPAHPLISLIDYSTINPPFEDNRLRWVQEFYSISTKRDVTGKYRYGQQSYDFDEGLMTFFAPGQVISIQLPEQDTSSLQPSGWILAIHPNFLFGTPLAKTIKKYHFFNYSVREALFLSVKEEKTITGLLENIKSEYEANIDQFSQHIIISQLGLLLNYAERFYQRQFLTRKISNAQVLDRLEELLEDYFNSDEVMSKGLPSVHEMAQRLNLTPDYLSSLLKSMTGLSTQQHIHNKLIEIAKVKLSTTRLTVGEIAYHLGFEHPQSFSKLFKSKTNQTPLEFRTSFN